MPEKGQRLAFWLCLRLNWWGLFSLGRTFCNLFILGKQLQLVHALRFGSEPLSLIAAQSTAGQWMPIGPVQLVLKLLNLQGQRLYFRRQKLIYLPQFCGVFRQVIKGVQHGHSIQICA